MENKEIINLSNFTNRQLALYLATQRAMTTGYPLDLRPSNIEMIANEFLEFLEQKEEKPKTGTTQIPTTPINIS